MIRRRTPEQTRLAELLADQELALRAGLVMVRVSRGYTRAQVADAIGISVRELRRFETRLDRASPHLSAVRAYAHAVGALVSYSVQPISEEHSA